MSNSLLRLRRRLLSVTSPSPFRDDCRRGELYWLDWSPGRGSEQTGLRPALVIQADAGNANPRYPLTVVATVSTKGKAGIPTHVALAPSPLNGLREVSYVKAEQIMTVAKDRPSRPHRFPYSRRNGPRRCRSETFPGTVSSLSLPQSVILLHERCRKAIEL